MHSVRAMSIVVAAMSAFASLRAAELDAYDVVWETPSADCHGSMPLGNGDIGLNLWVEEGGDLRFYISKTDAWDDNARLVKVGGVRVHLDPNPFQKGLPFRQTLRLHDATVSIEAGDGARRASLKVWVDANNPAVHVEIATAAPSAATASVELWRTQERELASLECSDVHVDRGAPNGMHAPTIVMPDVVLEGLADRVGWYHRNVKSVGPALLAEVQGLTGFPQKDPLLHRTFGAIMTGGARIDDRTLRSGSAAAHRFSLVVLTSPAATVAQWRAAVDAEIAKIAALPEGPRAAHEAWWREFWNRSWIRASRDPAARPVARSPVPANGHLVRIGEDQEGRNKFAGELGRVSIHTEALTDADIRALAELPPDKAVPPRDSLRFAGQALSPRTIADSSAWDFTHGLTVEAWVTPAALPGSGARIADKITPGGSDGFLLDTFPGNSARLICGDEILRLDNAAPAGRRTHIAAVIEPETRRMRILIDGRPAAASADSPARDPAFHVSWMYHLQRFMNACAGRGAHPIKFNGSIFTVPARGGDGDPDYRRWGPGYWWQNTRLPYIGMCASGDFDLMQPLFRMYVDELLELCTYRTKHYLGHDGAFYPECIYFWGPMFSETYGWTPFDKRADKLQESGWHKWEWVGGLELCALSLDYYEHTGDTEFLRSHALPFVRAILTFFEQHYRTNAEGVLVMHPSQALETWWECTNPMPELAGLIAVTDRLRALPEELVPAADRASALRLRAKLPPIPLREVDGKKALAPAEKFARKQNIENPELYAVYPFRLIAVGKPNLEWGLTALAHRWDRGNSGWRQDDIFMAYLGLAEEARANLVARAASHDPGSRFPAFWGPNYDWTPDQDHGGVLVKTLQSLALQTDGRAIYLLPAWPDGWDVSFKLHAPFATIVECEYRGGRIVALRVTPEERARDVVDCRRAGGK